MPTLGKIRTINTRIRRNKLKGIEHDAPTKALLHDASILGVKTRGGYLSKSKTALADTYLDYAIENYEDEYKDLKTLGSVQYTYRKTLGAFLAKYVTPSDYYQLMHGTSNADNFVEEIINDIKGQETDEYDEDEESEVDKKFADDKFSDDFTKWLLDDYNAEGSLSEKVFDKNTYHAKGTGRTTRKMR